MLGKRWGQPISLEPQGSCCRLKSRDKQRKLYGFQRLPRHREPSGDASVRLAVARMYLVAVSLDDQPYRRRSHPLLHAFRGHFMHLPHSCSNNLLRLPLQGTSLYPHPNCHQVLEARRHCSRSIAAIYHPIPPFHQKPQTNHRSSSFWRVLVAFQL